MIRNRRSTILALAGLMILNVGLLIITSCEKAPIKNASEDTEEVLHSTIDETSTKETRGVQALDRNFKNINAAVDNEEPDAFFERFYSKAQNQGFQPESNSLVLVLYKPDCPDCNAVENFISQKVMLGQQGASLITNVKDFEYNSIAVNIEREVPEWIQEIQGLNDEENVYHVPLVAVVSIKEVDGKPYWDVYKKTIGRNKDSIVNVLDFYIQSEFEDFLKKAPVYQDFSISGI